MIRYRKFGSVELNVTDLERSRSFYEHVLGLQFVETGPNNELRFRCSDDRYTVVLHQSSAAGYKRAAWALEDEQQFENLQHALGAKHVRWEDVSRGECSERLFARAIRMVEPNTGATMEFYLPGPGLEGYDFTATHTNIERLGHVVFNTCNFDAADNFFLEVLNFRASDRLADRVLLMRPFATPFHHGVGIARSMRNHFNHLNFMVADIDDIGRATNRLRKHDVTIVYGPGRHPASGSIFLYFLDPDGTTLEYSFGMELFPDDGARDARTLPPLPESSDSWLGTPHPLMAKSGEVEAYQIA